MRHSLVFWHSLFLLSLILFISLITFFRRIQRSSSSSPSGRSLPSPPFFHGQHFPFHLNTSLKGIELELSWAVDLVDQTVHFHVNFGKRASSILIGFSDHGSVEGSDFCLFWPDKSRMMDGWVDRRWTLRRDFHQDCELTMADAKTNQFRFRRKFATCDPRDYRIEKGTSNILLAVGTSKRKPMKSLRNSPTVAHEIRFTQLLPWGENTKENWMEGALITSDQDQPHLHTLDIRAENVSIPAQVTTYWCAIIELGEELKRRKHHVVKYEAIISPGNAPLVHHFEVFHCQQPTRPFAGDCSEDKPREARSCSKVVAAWAMGANPIVYPKEAGMPMGGPGFVPFLMVEIHYNNEHSVAGLRDSSGLRITYTDRLRAHDAGIMELGLIYSDANSIPPGQYAFPITGFCPSECTEKFPPRGIHIFASQLHAHLTGRKLFTSLIRMGRKVAELNRDNHYSPHWQHIQSLHPHVHVIPGDVLATTCVYDTRTRKGWTWGGYGIEDEMCVNYVHYYPAAEVEVCKSAVSNSSLHAFFAKLKVKDKWLSIHEKYSAVRWSNAKLALLRELYSVAPLNVACLQHSGELFPGHPSNWSRMPRPEYSAGPAEIDGPKSVAECPAIND